MRHPFPPAVLVASILLGFVLGKVFPVEIVPHEFRFFGWLIASVGAIFFAGGYLGLVGHRTPIEPTATPTLLVTNGFFSVTRNPFYLGYLLIALGAAVYFGNFFSFVAPLIFFGVVHTVVIPYEEEKLKRMFGEAYQSYARIVRRWI